MRVNKKDVPNARLDTRWRACSDQEGIVELTMRELLVFFVLF